MIRSQILIEVRTWCLLSSQKCSSQFIDIRNCYIYFSESVLLNYFLPTFVVCFDSPRLRRLKKKLVNNKCRKKNPTNSNQKNWNNNFIWQWNELNIFVMIDGIKIHHILKSGRKSRNKKHFNIYGTYYFWLTYYIWSYESSALPSSSLSFPLL